MENRYNKEKNNKRKTSKVNGDFISYSIIKEEVKFKISPYLAHILQIQN